MSKVTTVPFNSCQSQFTLMRHTPGWRDHIKMFMIYSHVICVNCRALGKYVIWLYNIILPSLVICPSISLSSPCGFGILEVLSFLFSCFFFGQLRKVSTHLTQPPSNLDWNWTITRLSLNFTFQSFHHLWAPPIPVKRAINLDK